MHITWLNLLFFSCSVMSDSLWPNGLQHARLPYPSPSPGVCSDSCPLNQWCHPTTSSSFSFPQSLPASGSFPMNIQGWFPLGLTGLIFLLSKGFSRVFFNTTVWKHQFFSTQGFPRSSVGEESAVQETWVQFLGWEDPLEEGMATYSSILAWRIPWTEEPGRL